MATSRTVAPIGVATGLLDSRLRGRCGGAWVAALIGVSSALLNSGCIAIYGHREVTAQVVDGDTAAPLAGAVVDVWHQHDYLVLNAPRAVTATSDEHGVVTMRVATLVPVVWAISMAGYETQVHQTGHEVVPAEFTGDGEGRVRIALFAPPPPEIVIVLPDGHRGPVAVAIDTAPTGLAPSPGVRSLELTAPPDAIVHGAVPGPFNLIDDQNPAIRMRFADGTLLATASTASYPDEVRQRRIFVRFGESATKVLYVVGTAADASAVEGVIEPVTMRDGRASRRFDQAAFDTYFGETRPSVVD